MKKRAIKIFNDVINIQAAGGFELRNCISNSQLILKNISKHLISQKYSFDVIAKIPNQSVLGMKWDTITDKFEFNMSFLEVFKFDKKTIPTKREILKAVMSIFDPLGILSPITIKGKIILQEL